MFVGVRNTSFSSNWKHRGLLIDVKASPNNVNYSREEIGLGRFESIDYRSKVLFYWHFTPCHGKELHSSRRQKRKINLRNNTISYAAGRSFGNDLGKQIANLRNSYPDRMSEYPNI